MLLHEGGSVATAFHAHKISQGVPTDRPPHLPDNEKTLGLAAMLVYVLYRATNALRRRPPQGGGEVQRVMRQVLFEAVRGHARAQS